jgi:hypothetical protein
MGADRLVQPSTIRPHLPLSIEAVAAPVTTRPGKDLDLMPCGEIVMAAAQSHLLQTLALRQHAMTD